MLQGIRINMGAHLRRYHLLHVHALIFVTVQAVAVLGVFPDKGHNKFVIA